MSCRPSTSCEQLYSVTVALVCRTCFIPILIMRHSFRHIDYKDLEGLKKYSEEGARMGFTGKQVIHPSQVPVVQTAFSPSEEKMEWATNLIKEFREHEKKGKGAFVSSM